MWPPDSLHDILIVVPSLDLLSLSFLFNLLVLLLQVIHEVTVILILCINTHSLFCCCELGILLLLGKGEQTLLGSGVSLQLGRLVGLLHFLEGVVLGTLLDLRVLQVLDERARSSSWVRAV